MEFMFKRKGGGGAGGSPNPAKQKDGGSEPSKPPEAAEKNHHCKKPRKHVRSRQLKLSYFFTKMLLLKGFLKKHTEIFRRN